MIILFYPFVIQSIIIIWKLLKLFRFQLRFILSQLSYAVNKNKFNTPFTDELNSLSSNFFLNK